MVRRLFADDAARGFALIDVCRQRFDVVLMNPPFGDASKPSKTYVERAYPRTKNDLYAAFIECGLRRLLPGGMLGAITSRTGFFLTSFQKWREEILLNEAAADRLRRPRLRGARLGDGRDGGVLLGEVRETEGDSFYSTQQQSEKASGFASAIDFLGSRTSKDDKTTYLVDSFSFRQVPGSPFAYWVSETIREI